MNESTKRNGCREAPVQRTQINQSTEVDFIMKSQIFNVTNDAGEHTFAMTDDGTLYLPSNAFGLSSWAVLEAVSYDGISIVKDDNNVYVPADWLRDECSHRLAANGFGDRVKWDAMCARFVASAEQAGGV